MKARAQVIYFRPVRVVCRTVSVFHFPPTEVATYSPRLPIFPIVMQSLSFISHITTDDFALRLQLGHSHNRN